jgi:hypothetical protein
MSRVIVLAALLIALGGAEAMAWLAQAPSGGGGAPSCNAIITGSGANGNAILTGSATALANLTCG